MFVCFEGIDGAGKSTQASRLVQYLKKQGSAAELVFDPGTTRIGTAIRQILLHNDAPISNTAQMLLFSAARAELAEYVRGRLAAGATVVCDRWLLSTLVYQGEINRIDTEFILTVFRQTTGLSPDICFVLDLPAELSLQRTGPGRDRYERIDNDMRERMRNTYLRFSGFGATPTPTPEVAKNVFLIDATLTSDQIHECVVQKYAQVFV